nr:hypothetical protein [uncultured Methanolobus sp.]
MNNLNDPEGSGEAGVLPQTKLSNLHVPEEYFLRMLSVEFSSINAIFSVQRYWNVPPSADGYFGFSLKLFFVFVLELKKEQSSCHTCKQDFYRAHTSVEKACKVQEQESILVPDLVAGICL